MAQAILCGKSVDTTRAAKSVSVTASVATSVWVADSAYEDYAYKATVTVNGVTTNNNIIVGLASTSTSAQEKACSEANVQCKAQGANQITLYAKSIPSVDISISVIILG